jgi:hypothetical protein
MPLAPLLRGLGLFCVAAIACSGDAMAQRVVDDFTNVSGVWLDSNRAAQGLMIEQLDAPGGAGDGGKSRVGVTWFTWAPAADANPGPRWMFGIGRRDGNTIVVDPVLIPTQGYYPYEPGEVAAEFSNWGRIEIEFSARAPGSQNTAVLTYAGPSGWGSGSRDIWQITVANTGIDYDLALSPPIWEPDFLSAGTYSDPASPGQGWILNNYWRTGLRVESALLWFTYDVYNRPSWLIGFDRDFADGIPKFEMQFAAGGGTFEGGAPELRPYGSSVFIQGSGGPPGGVNCGEPRSVGWGPVESTFPTSQRSIARLTRTYDPHILPADLCFSN